MQDYNKQQDLELTQWGKAYFWNNAQRSELKYTPLTPQPLDGAGSVWIPQWNEAAGEWQLGFEWDDPREVAGVEVVYGTTDCLPDVRNVRIDYWNTSWPTPMPERWQGARSGWIEMEDPRQGKWLWARGEVSAKGLSHSFSFDPLDIAEMDDDRRIEWAQEYNVTYRKTLKIRLAVKGSLKPVFQSIRVWGTARLEECEAEIRFGCSGEKEDWSGEVQILNGKIIALSPVAFDEKDAIASGETEKCDTGNCDTGNCDAGNCNTGNCDTGNCDVGNYQNWNKNSTNRHKWNCHTVGAPKGLSVKFLKAVGSMAQGDQTLLTLRTKTRSFTFLASDLEKGPIWIKDYGVLVSRPLEDGDWIKETERACRNASSIYSRVAHEPEQSFERATAEIPPLDVTRQAPYGRYTILGWEGVKQKFALRYNGEVFADKRQVKMAGRDAAKVRWAGNSLHFRFGTGDPVDFRQRKDGSRQHMPEPQIPVYVTQWEDREIEYTQTAFGALVNGVVEGPDAITGDEEMLAMIRLKIRNTTEGSKKAVLCLDITPAEDLLLDGEELLAVGRVTPSETVKDGWKVQPYKEPRLRLHLDKKEKGSLRIFPLSEGGILTKSLDIDRYHFTHFGDTPKATPLTTHIPNALRYEVELPGSSSHEIDILIPFTTYSLLEGRKRIGGLSFDSKLREVTDYWNAFNRRGAQIEIPDKVLENLFKAVPWHVLMTADRDPVSKNYMLPAATYAYDVCGNEACMQVRLLDMLGYHDHAEKYLETFLHTQSVQMPDGDFSSKDGAFVAVSFDAGETKFGKFGYNLDHGFILSGFADHYFITGDKAWLKKVSDSLVSACEFVLRERKATMLTEEDGSRVGHYGLLPMGHLEDNCEWRHWFAVNGQAYGGMARAAGALSEIAHPEAERLLREAAKYREDILAAVQRATEESPVVQLPDGVYIPHVPTRTALRGRDWGWFREAGYGPLHLVDGLVLDPQDEKVTWILKDQEDNLFVSRHYGRAVDLEKYWFSRGGVTIQANVLNNGPAYLFRDQTAHAIRSLYNNVGQHLYPDVLAFSEHPVAELGSGFGPFFKTPDEAQFLVWLRNYMVREEGDTLWICQGAPRKWYADGERIKASGLACRFGELDFSVESRAAASVISAFVKLPERKAPDQILFRLRHPDGKPMKRVMVNGKEHEAFDRDKEIVILKGLRDNVEITVWF